MDKATTIRLKTSIVKQAKIKCIENDLSFSKYIEKLIEADLKTNKKKSTC